MTGMWELYSSLSRNARLKTWYTIVEWDLLETGNSLNPFHSKQFGKLSQRLSLALVLELRSEIVLADRS